MKNTLCTLTAAVLCTLLLFGAGISLERADAAQLTPYFSSTDGSGCSDISDGDYFTTEYFDPGTEITVSSDTPMDSLYIVWENIPGNWTLQVNGENYTYGQDGYLHEYIKLPAGTNAATICVGSERLTIADVYAFSEGELPGFVQTWEAPYDQADILLISTHADDEVLFFGGIIPDYIDRGDVRVQVAYFTDLFQTEPYRNHEILNGLWHMGVTHYPQLGEFYDYYSESYEEAVDQYDYDQSMDYIVKTIRRFKPQIVIAQDPENGEYGHGGHMWCARIVEDALDVTNDPESYPDSAAQYGTWDVPKAYFHLYPENTLELDARTPLSSFGGKTEIEVAKEAYEEHQSQQWCWFYVSDGYDDEGNPDGYEYSCTKYGLYRTLVGEDTGANDLMENVVSYNEQDRRAAQAKAEEEAASREAEEAARKAAEAETATEAVEGEESVATATAQSVLDESNPTAVPGGKNTTAITILIIIAVIVALIMIGLIVISRSRKKMREKERKLERSRQEVENRMRGRYTSSVNRSSVGYRSTSSGSRSGRTQASGTAARSRQGTSQSRQSSQSNYSSRQGNSQNRSGGQSGQSNYSSRQGSSQNRSYRDNNGQNNEQNNSGNSRPVSESYRQASSRDPYRR